VLNTDIVIDPKAVFEVEQGLPQALLIGISSVLKLLKFWKTGVGSSKITRWLRFPWWITSQTTMLI
jgi:hypothetical protein